VNTQEESIIIKRVLSGDVNAFAALVNKYKALAVTLSYNVLLNRQDAEDVAQDAFIKAYTSLRYFKGNSRFSTWLYRIVLNTTLNRRKQRLNTFSEDEKFAEEIENFKVTDHYNLADQKKYIKQAIEKLNESERVCITLYYLNELSVEEINELTGFSSANIKVLLFRGRKHLYEELHSLLRDEIKDLI